MTTTIAERELATAIGREIDREGSPIGRDPRSMSHDELRALGHEAMSAQAAIRARCLDCCAGSSAEVRMCMAVRCPSWPFRMGKSPWRAPPSEAQRAAGEALAARMRSGAKIDVLDEDFSQEPTRLASEATA